jgi:hypothetical protein
MRSLVWLVLLAVATGCASSPLAKQVQAKDWAGVEHAVRSAGARDEWTAQDTRDLAQQVLELEIEAAPSTAAKQWVPGLRACARAVVPALKARAEKSDATAAAIARILIEAEAVSLNELVDEYRDSKDPLWRAVAMRAAVTREHAALRLQGLRDPDSGVRRAALVAMRVGGDDAGAVPVDELLQIARHDPEPVNRSLAARAATSQGDERAVLFLRDYWSEVPLEERITYVEAWAQPRALAAGGERELEWVMGSDAGLPAVVAALALQSRSEAARAVLGHAVQAGAPREQELAVQMAALGFPEFVKALKTLLDDPSSDDQLQVTILLRLARLQGEARAARTRLKKLAASPGAAAPAARHGLAYLGDDSVQGALIGELGFGSASSRLEAAAALLALEQDSKVAPLLGERVRDTRVKAACLILASSPH